MKTSLKINNSGGFTLMELLIALLISGLLTTTAYQFYSTVSHQSEVQYDISEMQHAYRISLEDIRKNLRSAGYMLNGHQPFDVSDDSLVIYASITQAVDTTIYYLQEYSENDYLAVPGASSSVRIYFLMKKINSGPSVVFAEGLEDITFELVTPSTILVTLASQVGRSDEDFSNNDGFRDFTLTERINMRNVN